MKKIKTSIIILLMIIIFLVIILLAVDAFSNKKVEENNDINEYKETVNIDSVSNMLEFDNVSLSIKKYIRFLTIDINNRMQYTQQELSYGADDFAISQGITNEEEKKEALYNLLDEEYKKTNNITTSNIYNFIGDEYKLTTFTPISMTCKNIDTFITRYCIYGRTIKQDKLGNTEAKYNYYILTQDNLNSTFSVMPLEEKNIKNIQDVNLESKIKGINPNKFNSFSISENLNAADIAKTYFTLYKQDMEYDIQRAYNTLSEEYRNKKFGNINEYRNYINIKMDEVKKATIKEYSYTQTKEYKQYLCIDNNGNYYVFRDTGVMNYTVLLDTYTIDMPEFLDQYNKASEQKKVALNIQKFFLALDNNDYKYAYSILSLAFRNNKYNNQAIFENYIKNNLYSEREIEYDKFNKESSNTYSYVLKIKDKTGANSYVQTFTVIMKLNSGTDFEMSFSIN